MSAGDVSLRVLGPGDEPILEVFLHARRESSLFLISNLERGGIVDRGVRFTGTFVGSFRGDTLIGVCAHCWNGNVVVQAPDGSLDLVLRAAERSGRSIEGLIGPWEQVAPLLAAAPFAVRPRRLEAREILYALPLERLRVPPLLASGRASVRRAKPEELELLSSWSVAYAVEALNEPDNDEIVARERTAREVAAGELFVLELGDGAAVAKSGFNAVTRDTVQIGGVWTPPQLRRRGYARAVVAGQLQIARGEGKMRSVLFTPTTNTPAQRAYEAIGYVPIGEYGLIHFSGEGSDAI
jgi:ribosomal protein S18 acetylase RimI-like enzyme